MSNYSSKRKAATAFLTNTLQMNHNSSIDATVMFNDVIALINSCCTGRQREVIYYRFALSHSVSESAALMSLTESAVQKLEQRALNALADKIGGFFK